MFGGLIHRRFVAVARAARDRVALQTPRGEHTFAAVMDVATRIARALAARDIERVATRRLAIVDLRDEVVAPAILGALMAGWAYAVIDPRDEARARAQIARLGCEVTLGDLASTGVLDDTPTTLDNLASARGAPDACDPDAMASLYFTSGSTGAPRAIAGRACGIDHHVAWEIDFLGLDDGSRGAIVHAPTYDAYLPDLLVPICAGGVACTPPAGLFDDPAAACRWIEDERITLLHCVPSLLRALLAGNEAARLRGLRHVLLAGEVVRVDDVQRARKVTNARLINLYGPTEATLVKLHHEITDADVDEVPIGAPMPEVSVELLDDHGRPCTTGQTGQIAIRSRYGSLGYLDEPELTRAKFFDATRGEQVYLTGDYGVRRDDGALLFRGRRDRQIKLLGARVDLDEVEAIVTRCDGVVDAVVVPDATSTVLHGAVVLAGGVPLSTIRARVTAQLSPAMRLARLTEVAALPRTTSGKLDRRRVAEMFEVT